jgi:ABC-type uncharacterized transport system substrate-binding protein
LEKKLAANPRFRLAPKSGQGMKRREFITLLGAAATWPLAARAQQPGERMRRIGVLMGFAEDDPEAKARLAAFRQGLEKRGWSEGRNVRIDTRFAPAGAQAQVVAKELVALQPDVILAHSTPVTAALQRESRTIPIVFAGVADPIGSGFIASLPRPGGNITGVMQYEASVTGKWLAMLKEVAHGLVRAGFVANPKTATYYDYYVRAGEAVAPSLGIEAVPILVENVADIERAIESFARRTAVWSCCPTSRPPFIATSSSRSRRAPLAGGLLGPFPCRGRRSHVLRERLGRLVSAGGSLCRPHPARRQTCRPSGAGGDQVRDGRQPQDCKDDRPHRPARPARGRRRGDRVRRRGFISLLGAAAAWPLAAHHHSRS